MNEDNSSGRSNVAQGQPEERELVECESQPLMKDILSFECIVNYIEGSLDTLY
jgi:hypothetical protein